MPYVLARGKAQILGDYGNMLAMSWPILSTVKLKRKIEKDKYLQKTTTIEFSLSSYSTLNDKNIPCKSPLRD